MKKADKAALELYIQKLSLIRAGEINTLETQKEKLDRIALAKKDFKFFVRYYLPHYITDTETGKIIDSAPFHLNIANKVKKDRRIKGILRWGRAQAKSVVADVFIPLWLWINDEVSYMVLIGNNYDKAQILQQDIQAEFEANPKIKHDFGDQKIVGSWEKGYFRTKSGFVCKAIGMGQDVRGLRMKSQRPDLIIADDLEDKDTLRNPKKQDEIANWILTSVLPTMDGATARFLMANNLFAPRMIQTVLEELRPNWYVHRVDAYNPVTYEPAWKEKYTPDYWRMVEDEIGRLSALAEYCNTPHIEGKIFKSEQIIWHKRPALNHFKTIVGHWDIAYAGNSTSDYNAVRIWALYDEKFWYIASFVRQTKMKDAAEWMCNFQKNLPESVIIHWRFESQFWNDEVKRTIGEAEEKYKLRLNIIKVDTPKTRKLDRILQLQPYYQNKRIYYDAKMKSDADTQIGLEQLYGIEPGYRTHDDAPDADQQAITYLEKFIRKARFKSTSGRYKTNDKRKWQ